MREHPSSDKTSMRRCKLPKNICGSEHRPSMSRRPTESYIVRTSLAHSVPAADSKKRQYRVRPEFTIEPGVLWRPPSASGVRIAAGSARPIQTDLGKVSLRASVAAPGCPALTAIVPKVTSRHDYRSWQTTRINATEHYILSRWITSLQSSSG